MKKRFMGFLLAIAMILCMLPAAAYAETTLPEDAEEVLLEEDRAQEDAEEVLLEENSAQEDAVTLLEDTQDTSYIIEEYEKDESNILHNQGKFWFLQEQGGWLKLVGVRGVLEGELEIPTQVDGYQVEVIGDGAFENIKTITGTLHLPSVIREIGKNAFRGCTGLTGLDLKYGLKHLGDGAFDSCTGLTGDLIIPDSVEYLGGDSFAFCSGFTGTIKFPENENCNNIPGHMFYHAGNFTGNIVIPDNITSVDSNAFHFCDFNNATLTLSQNLKFIGHWAFFACDGLVGNLVIPEGVTEIDYGAFTSCSGFTGDLILPDSCTRIAYQAFDNCRGFNGTLHLPDHLVHIGYRAFYDDCFTGDLYIPDSVEEIGSEAFAFCRNFDGQLHIPENGKYTEIQDRTFGYCEKLSGTLTIPSNIKKIKEESFRECAGFTGDLIIPSGVNSIGYQAFLYCKGFDGEISLPTSLASIESGAFEHCESLTGSLTIPESLNSVASYAFDSCSSLNGTLDLGHSVKSIGGYAFRNCGFTGNLYLPESITYIGDRAFNGCNGFTGTLTLPANVTEIDDYAFAWCENLTGGISFPDKLLNIGAYAFYHCSNLVGDLSIPEGCKYIFNFCFADCPKLNGTLTIPETITTLGSYAFSGDYFHTIHNYSEKTIPVKNHEDEQYSPSNYIIGQNDIDKIWYCDATGSRVNEIAQGTYTLYQGTTVEPKKIRLDKTSAEMAIKNSLQLKVIFDPNDTTNTSVTWKSSDPAVVSVDTNGLITAQKYGTATITVTSKANSKLKATCKVQTRFRDVMPGKVPDSIFKYIYWGADNNIIGGYSTGYFGRSDSCTRAQFATMIWKMAGTPKASKPASSYFKDVGSSTAIAWAYENKIIGGYSDGTFKPTNKLTRSNFVIMLWKWAGKPAVKKGVTPKSFSDVPKTDASYKAVQWASSYSIIGGYSNGTFGIKDNCTRQQIVTMLYKYKANYAK